VSGGDSTLYQTQAGHGYVIAFDPPQRLVQVQIHGTHWIARRSPLDGPLVAPASSPGVSGSVVRGFLRVGDDEVIGYGAPRSDPDFMLPAEKAGTAESRSDLQRDGAFLPLDRQIAGLLVWAESDGQIVTSTEGI
jgi:hypothetical protein